MAVAVFWLYLLSVELLAVLETLGIIFSIPDDVLGMTFYMIGNNVGDGLSYIISAKMNQPYSAVSAMFAAPTMSKSCLECLRLVHSH